MRFLAPPYSSVARFAGFCLVALAALALPQFGQGQETAGNDPAAGEADAGRRYEFTPAEKAWLAAHKVIRVGAETNYAPYEFQDSRSFSGVVADYMELPQTAPRRALDVHQMPDFAAVEAKLQKREVDVVLALRPRRTGSSTSCSPSPTCTMSM
jgi:hypothetical protein